MQLLKRSKSKLIVLHRISNTIRPHVWHTRSLSLSRSLGVVCALFGSVAVTIRYYRQYRLLFGQNQINFLLPQRSVLVLLILVRYKYCCSTHSYVAREMRMRNGVIWYSVVQFIGEEHSTYIFSYSDHHAPHTIPKTKRKIILFIIRIIFYRLLLMSTSSSPSRESMSSTTSERQVGTLLDRQSENRMKE